MQQEQHPIDSFFLLEKGTIFFSTFLLLLFIREYLSLTFSLFQEVILKIKWNPKPLSIHSSHAIHCLLVQPCNLLNVSLFQFPSLSLFPFMARTVHSWRDEEQEGEHCVCVLLPLLLLPLQFNYYIGSKPYIRADDDK